jgi:hypothetical protein
METIHPNDIQELDADTFSFITLKNGNMIMIDDSVPEKPKTTQKKSDTDQPKTQKIPQNLMISEQLNISFRGEDQINNNNLELLENKINIDNNENKVIVKSDFNLISQISNNTNFSFIGKPNQNRINNIPTIPINKNENHLLNNNIYDNNNEKTDKTEMTKSLNNFSPILSPNENNKTNINQNILLNDQNKDSKYDANNTSSNRNNSDNEENKEDEISSRIRRKSRNYIEKIEKLVGERNKHTVKAVISLNIPSDVTRQISKTQKQFNILVTQLRQKQNKYRKKNNENIYQRYYELYKDKNSKMYNNVLGPNFNRIKYYQEAEAEDFGDISLIGSDTNVNVKSSFNNNSNYNLLINNTSNTFYGGFNNNNINKSTNYNIINGSKDFNLNKTMTSFNGNKSRPLSANRYFNNKLVGSSFGYSSALIYPSNRFLSKLGP